MTPLLGELAALGAALSWAFASIFFTRAGQGLGSPVMNTARLVVAAAALATLHLLLTGAPWPVSLTADQTGWLLVSGLAAHVVGDGVLYMAYVRVGPRLSLLVGSLTPILSGLLAWALLGEILSPMVMAGVALTVGGVAWVVLERPNGRFSGGTRERRLGLVLALVSAIMQAVGIVTARYVLTGGLPALSAVTVRIGLSAAVMMAWLLGRGQAPSGLHSLISQREATRAMIGGALTGPIVGATLSMVAMQAVQVGVASTLLSLPPVFLLPLSAVVYQERVSARAALGTLVAIAGVALLLLR